MTVRAALRLHQGDQVQVIETNKIVPVARIQHTTRQGMEAVIVWVQPPANQYGGALVPFWHDEIA